MFRQNYYFSATPQPTPPIFYCLTALNRQKSLLFVVKIFNSLFAFSLLGVLSGRKGNEAQQIIN